MRTFPRPEIKNSPEKKPAASGIPPSYSSLALVAWKLSSPALFYQTCKSWGQAESGSYFSTTRTWQIFYSLSIHFIDTISELFIYSGLTLCLLSINQHSSPSSYSFNKRTVTVKVKMLVYWAVYSEFYQRLLLHDKWSWRAVVGRVESKLGATAFFIPLLNFICLICYKDSIEDNLREKERKSQKKTTTIPNYLNGQCIHRGIHLFPQASLATGCFQQSFSFWMHSLDAVYKERLEKKLLMSG